MFWHSSRLNCAAVVRRNEAALYSISRHARRVYAFPAMLERSRGKGPQKV